MPGLVATDAGWKGIWPHNSTGRIAIATESKQGSLCSCFSLQQRGWLTGSLEPGGKGAKVGRCFLRGGCQSCPLPEISQAGSARRRFWGPSYVSNMSWPPSPPPLSWSSSGFYFILFFGADDSSAASCCFNVEMKQPRLIPDSLSICHYKPGNRFKKKKHSHQDGISILNSTGTALVSGRNKPRSPFGSSWARTNVFEIEEGMVKGGFLPVWLSR